MHPRNRYRLTFGSLVALRNPLRRSFARASSLLPTAHCLLPAASFVAFRISSVIVHPSLFFTAYCLLPTANCPGSFVAFPIRLGDRRPEIFLYCLPPTAYCLLPVASFVTFPIGNGDSWPELLLYCRPPTALCVGPPDEDSLPE